jgi:hypothetical protein
MKRAERKTAGGAWIDENQIDQTREPEKSLPLYCF